MWILWIKTVDPTRPPHDSTMHIVFLVLMYKSAGLQDHYVLRRYMCQSCKMMKSCICSVCIAVQSKSADSEALNESKSVTALWEVIGLTYWPTFSLAKLLLLLLRRRRSRRWSQLSVGLSFPSRQSKSLSALYRLSRIKASFKKENLLTSNEKSFLLKNC